MKKLKITRSKAERQLNEKVELLVLNEDFQNGVKRIRKKWKIPTEGFTLDEGEKWRKKLPHNKREKFEAEVAEFRIKDCKKMNNFALFFEEYIICNDTVCAAPPIGMVERTDPMTKEPGLYIQIFPETTKDDFSNIYPRIKAYQEIIWKKKTSSRYKPIIDFKEQKRIFLLRESGEDYGKIRDIINIEFNHNAALSKEDIIIKYHNFKKKVNESYGG